MLDCVLDIIERLWNQLESRVTVITFYETNLLNLASTKLISEQVNM